MALPPHVLEQCLKIKELHEQLQQATSLLKQLIQTENCPVPPPQDPPEHDHDQEEGQDLPHESVLQEDITQASVVEDWLEQIRLRNEKDHDYQVLLHGDPTQEWWKQLGDKIISSKNIYVCPLCYGLFLADCEKKLLQPLFDYRDKEDPAMLMRQDVHGYCNPIELFEDYCFQSVTRFLFVNYRDWQKHVHCHYPNSPEWFRTAYQSHDWTVKDMILHWQYRTGQDQGSLSWFHNRPKYSYIYTTLVKLLERRTEVPLPTVELLVTDSDTDSNSSDDFVVSDSDDSQYSGGLLQFITERNLQDWEDVFALDDSDTEHSRGPARKRLRRNKAE